MSALDVPRTLPGVDHLSASSVRTFLECPERWRRRYIAGEFEPATPPMIVGTAIHRAEGENFQHRIDGGMHRPTSDVLDVFSQEFDLEVERRADTIAWEDARPGRVKDQGVRVTRAYHETVAARVVPVTVERRFDIAFDGVDWTFTGYLDLELARRGGGTRIADLKSRSPKRGIVSPTEAAEDVQVTANLWARRAEGEPAHGFDFHNLVLPKPRTQPGPRNLLITPAHRTDAELDVFAQLILSVAAEIAWRAENDHWRGPAQSWRCSEAFCGFWHACSFGGAHRSQFAVGLEPRPVAPPHDSAVLAAVDATKRKDATTTAERVAHHLGISTTAAAGRLAALVRQGRLEAERPTKLVRDPANPTGRRIRVRDERGARVYRRAAASLESQLAASLSAA